MVPNELQLSKLIVLRSQGGMPMRVRDPFQITGPAVVSFSGGRTSGMVLYKILEAHGGKLPPDVLVCFCNTGKERPETLDFVEECSQRWSVPIVWLEYRCDAQSGPTFAVVNHATADRSGRVFEAAIKGRGRTSGFLPNPLARYCTIEMKILTLIRYLESLGWETWSSAIGFRADEPRRVAKARGGNNRDEREMPVFPLHQAGVTRADVMSFWSQQPFDLQLEIDEGNCDLCFLKGAGKLIRIMRDRPDLANWWVEQEQRTGNRFRNDRPSYAALLEQSQRPSLFPLGMLDDPDELSIACHCTD